MRIVLSVLTGVGFVIALALFACLRFSIKYGMGGGFDPSFLFRPSIYWMDAAVVFLIGAYVGRVSCGPYHGDC
jgi:hypothetical protein